MRLKQQITELNFEFIFKNMQSCTFEQSLRDFIVNLIAEF